MSGDRDEEERLSAFLSPLSSYVERTESGRLRCLVTGHEMAPTLAAARPHFEGKRFGNLVKKWKPAFDYAQFEPYIVADSSNPKHFLYCRLTKRRLPRQAAVVEKHVQGRRYRSNLALQKRKKEEVNEVEAEEEVDAIPEFVREMEEMEKRGEEEDEQEIVDGEIDEDDEDVGDDDVDVVNGRVLGDRRLVELEDNVFVFQGRKKRRKGGGGK